MQETAVIFDMDGIIIDSEPLHMEWSNELYKQLGIHVPREVHYTFIGGAVNRKWNILKETYRLSQTLEEFKDMQKKVFSAHSVDYRSILCDGVVELLKSLQKEKIKIALASSSSREKIEEVLQTCEIKQYFQWIISGEELSESKPNPEIFLQSAKKLAIPPHKCVVIEDSLNGVTAAKRAGMKAIGVKHATIEMDLTLADKAVHSLNELQVQDIKELIE